MNRTRNHIPATRRDSIEIVVLSDSDDEDADTTFRQDALHPGPTFTNLNRTEVWDGEDTDEELPDVNDIMALNIPSRGIATHRSISNSSLFSTASTNAGSYSTLDRLSSASPDQPPRMKRKTSRTSFDDDDENEDDSQVLEPGPSKPKRARQTVDKAAKLAAAEDKKRAKEEAQAAKAKEKLAAKEKAAAKKDAAAVEKLAKKEHKANNNLVNDKKSTIVDMTVEISTGLYGHVSFKNVARPLTEKIKEAAAKFEQNQHEGRRSKWPVTTFESDIPGVPFLVRWSRWVYREYDHTQQEWFAVPPHPVVEPLYLIYLAVETFRDAIKSNPNSVCDVLQRLRDRLGEKGQLFIMIDGMHRPKSIKTADKQEIEKHLAELQILFRCFVVHVDGVESTVDWLYDITADLGIKPHKLIDRAHLPFCAITKNVGTCNTSQDMYLKMLQEIYRVTEPMAQNIVEHRFPTLGSMFKAYGDPRKSQDVKNKLLVGIPMGGRGSRDIGDVISTRVCSIFTGIEPLAFVGVDDKKKRNNEEED